MRNMKFVTMLGVSCGLSLSSTLAGHAQTVLTVNPDGSVSQVETASPAGSRTFQSTPNRNAQNRNSQAGNSPNLLPIPERFQRGRRLNDGIGPATIDATATTGTATTETAMAATATVGAAMTFVMAMTGTAMSSSLATIPMCISTNLIPATTPATPGYGYPGYGYGSPYGSTTNVYRRGAAGLRLWQALSLWTSPTLLNLCARRCCSGESRFRLWPAQWLWLWQRHLQQPEHHNLRRSGRRLLDWRRQHTLFNWRRSSNLDHDCHHENLSLSAVILRFKANSK